jgi:RecA/RadA recombinase
MAKKRVDLIKEAMTPSLTKVEPVMLSSGSTLVNLVLSGSVNGGWRQGHFYLLVGDSQSGKSWICLATLAEATLLPSFDKHRLVRFDSEDGALMDIGSYFGSKLEKRLDTKRPRTLEEMYYGLDDLIEDKVPFIAVIDSMDGLTSKDDDQKFKEDKKAFQAQKETSGSFGTARAKTNSRNLRTVTNAIGGTQSIVLSVSQTRDNLGFGAQFRPKTRAGGNALKFFATNELWFSVKKKLTKRINGRERPIGNLLEIRSHKNRQTGMESRVEVGILHGVGIDDTGSMIRFLIDEKALSGNETNVSAPDFDFEGSIEDLVELIESQNREKELRAAVATVWGELESASRVKRKPRYGQEESSLDS